MRLLLLWSLLLPLSGFAQTDTSKQAVRRPPFTLKIAPLELINPFQQSLVVQADIPLSTHWGIDLGVGMTFNSWQFAVNKGESYRGIKLKPMLKYYTGNASSSGEYIALVLKFNYIHNDRYVNLLRQGRQYTEVSLQRKKLVTWGVGLRYGQQYYLGPRKRFVLEPFTGIGLRQVHVSQYALPSDAELLQESEWFNFDRQPGIYTTPDLMLGFSIGWVLGNRH